MNRRMFLTAASVAAGALAADAPSLEELSVADLQLQMQSGALTSQQLVQFYLDRIASLDKSGPRLNSVIETNPDALVIAQALDAERKRKGPRGPMHGIPVLLKDNIDTNDRMKTTAGSLVLADAPTPADSFVAARLRTAGAVILGKTNLSEWANFRSSHSTSGWSGRGGLTRNPYVLDRNPCGSSAGSGVAVSASLTAVAVGTETDGSIVCPSSMNGVVGIKPTLGLVSRSGIIPIAASQDTAGPMARTVRDAATLLSALASADPHDPAAQPDKTTITDYAQFCTPNGLRGARIGIARQYFNMGPAVTGLLSDCIKTLQQGGAEIVDPVTFEKFETWHDTEILAFNFEFKQQLNAYLQKRGGPIQSLADCIAFNKAHSAREMPYFDQDLFEAAQQTTDADAPKAKHAVEESRKAAREHGIDWLLKKHKLDAIFAPTSGLPAITDLALGDRGDGGCSSPAAVAGYPHITVPGGFLYGLPLGVSFFAGAWSEPKLIAIAYGFEQLRRARQAPRFLPTIVFA